MTLSPKATVYGLLLNSRLVDMVDMADPDIRGYLKDLSGLIAEKVSAVPPEYETLDVLPVDPGYYWYRGPLSIRLSLTRQILEKPIGVYMIEVTHVLDAVMYVCDTNTVYEFHSDEWSKVPVPE